MHTDCVVSALKSCCVTQNGTALRNETTASPLRLRLRTATATGPLWPLCFGARRECVYQSQHIECSGISPVGYHIACTHPSVFIVYWSTANRYIVDTEVRGLIRVCPMETASISTVCAHTDLPDGLRQMMTMDIYPLWTKQKMAWNPNPLAHFSRSQKATVAPGFGGDQDVRRSLI